MNGPLVLMWIECLKIDLEDLLTKNKSISRSYTRYIRESPIKTGDPGRGLA